MIENIKGDGQKTFGVGLISDRSDIPPRFDPGDDHQGEEDRGFGISLWDILAKPIRGIFDMD